MAYFRYCFSVSVTREFSKRLDVWQTSLNIMARRRDFCTIKVRLSVLRLV